MEAASHLAMSRCIAPCFEHVNVRGSVFETVLVALQPSTIFGQTANATCAMSAEYLLQMELLRRNREELTARRQEIERRIALREATAAEFSAVALQSSKQKWKSLRASAIAAKKRNDEFVREIHETQRKVDDMYVRTKQKLWPGDNQLEIEKARYLRKAEELYPAWQEKQQAMRVQTLRELEEKKRAIEKRRYLAKKTFETEQTLDDLIRQTNHEIELAHNLEKNEAFEREVLRNQSAIQSQRVEESIREHATGARMYMTQQAVEQLTEAHQLQGDVQEKLFETFSPRGAVNAMRQANQSINFVESVDNNAEDLHYRPRRGQSIAVPAPQYRDPTVKETFPSDQFDPYAHTQLLDEHDPATQARAWARSGFPTSEMVNPSQSVPPTAHPPSQRVQSTPPTLIPAHREHVSPASLPTPVAQDGRLVPQTLPSQAVFATANLASTLQTYPTTSTLGSTSAFPARDLPFDTKPELVINNVNAEETCERAPQMQLHHDGHEEKSSAPPSQMQPSESVTLKLNSSTGEAKPTSVLVRNATPPKATPQGEQGIYRHDERVTAAAASIHPVTLPSFKDKELPGKPTELLIQDTIHVEKEVVSVPTPDIPASHPKENTPPRRHEPRESSLPAYETYKFVEIAQKEPLSMAKIEETKEKDKDDGDITRSIDSLASANFSPVKSDSAYNPTMPSADLSLNLVNSYESSQSSLMDFSVGKLLQTPQKLDFATTQATSRRELPPKNDVVESPERSAESVQFAGLNTSIDSHVADSPDRFAAAPQSMSSRTISFEKPSTAHAVASAEERTGSAKFKGSLDHTRDAPTRKPQSFVFSSLDSVSELGSPAIPRPDGQDTMIESVSDFGSPVAPSHNAPARSFPPRNPSPPVSPTYEDDGGQAELSLVASLSMPERLKALTALIARVEEGTSEGEQINSSLETGSSHDTKRELLRMAVSGRKAQINFFGADVCFELVVELAKELGPVLFPSKAFEGIMNDQKMKKVHQNGKEKEPDMWKAFASHIKQLHAAKAMPVGALADLFTNAFLRHDASNQRSQRKLREFLLSLCGATDNTPSKQQPSTPASPRQASQASESSFQPRTMNSFEREATASPQMPSLLQTAFLQASSPPKQAKSYGIASSAKKKSGSDDVLKSMAASPTKLSQKLLRGGKMGDYSEFEEEEEINLENLIGSKASSASSSSSSISKATASYRTGASSSATSRLAAMREDKDDFDVDF